MRKHRPPDRAPVREDRDPGAVREELLAPRPQCHQPPTVAEESEPQTIAAEALGDVAAVEEPQLQQAEPAAATDGEGAHLDASHDPAPDVEDDDDADPQPYPDVAHAERSRRQEHEGGVVSGPCPPRGSGADVEEATPAGRDPDALRAHAKPRRRSVTRSYARLAAQRACEARSRDVDEQGSASRIPHRHRRHCGASEREAERARAEPDAAAGRGTREGCRGRSEDERHQRASHRPITVKVSVAE